MLPRPVKAYKSNLETFKKNKSHDVLGSSKEKQDIDVSHWCKTFCEVDQLFEMVLCCIPPGSKALIFWFTCSPGVPDSVMHRALRVVIL